MPRTQKAFVGATSQIYEEEPIYSKIKFFKFFLFLAII